MHVSVRMRRAGGPDAAYDHGYPLSGVVYAAIERVNPALAAVLHDGHGRSPYVLSEIHRVPGRPTEAWLRVGTDREDVADALAAALAAGAELALGPTRFLVEQVVREEPVVRAGEYATLSPILLIDKESGRSVVHDTPGYREFLETAINAQIRSNTKHEGSVRVLQVEPQAVRKRTIKTRKVLAQKARLLLDGPEEELRHLVDRGIGKSPAMGFGMVVLDRRWAVD